MHHEMYIKMGCLNASTHKLHILLAKAQLIFDLNIHLSTDRFDRKTDRNTVGTRVWYLFF